MLRLYTGLDRHRKEFVSMPAVLHHLEQLWYNVSIDPRMTYYNGSTHAYTTMYLVRSGSNVIGTLYERASAALEVRCAILLAHNVCSGTLERLSNVNEGA